MNFIGKTGIIQKVLESKTERIATGGSGVIERHQLFTGWPGVGKSELAKQWGAALVGDIAHLHVCLDIRIGNDVNAELVRQWVQDSHYRPMQGRCDVKVVNEIDSVTPAALNALRQYLDDLPPYPIFIGTTNKGVKDLPGPLQSRFQVWEFDPVPAADIAALLRQAHGLDEPTVTSIAQHASGCVRAALCDAQSELDARAPRQPAA